MGTKQEFLDGKNFPETLFPASLPLGHFENHVVFVDICVANFERRPLVAENGEAERRIDAPRRSLMIAHGEDDFLQAGERPRTL